MAATTNRLLPWLRLVRLGTLFSPACDVLAGACVLVRRLPLFPSGNATIADLAPRTAAPLAIAAAAVASLCIYAAGMVWNDIADRGEDARQRPERPLPRGDIGLAAAVLLGCALLAAALLVSPCPRHHAALAALALAYDFALKRVRWLGAVAMGCLRAGNLLTVSQIALHEDPAGGAASLASFLLPLPVGMPLAWAATCYGIYIAAVTVLGILEDAPAPRRSLVLLTQSVTPVAALVGIAAVQPGLGLAVLLALVPVGLFVRRMLRVTVWDQRAIRGSMLWLLLGTMLYTALLALAAGIWPAAAGIGLCIVPARWIARRIQLT